MKDYDGAARRFVQLTTFLLRRPSDCCQAEGQSLAVAKAEANHIDISQMGLPLTQPRSMQETAGHGSASRISTRQNPMSRILHRESHHAHMIPTMCGACSVPHYNGIL